MSARLKRVCHSFSKNHFRACPSPRAGRCQARCRAASPRRRACPQVRARVTARMKTGRAVISVHNKPHGSPRATWATDLSASAQSPRLRSAVLPHGPNTSPRARCVRCGETDTSRQPVAAPVAASSVAASTLGLSARRNQMSHFLGRGAAPHFVRQVQGRECNCWARSRRDRRS